MESPRSLRMPILAHDPTRPGLALGCREVMDASACRRNRKSETEAGSSTRCCTIFPGVSLQLRRPDTAPSTVLGYTLFEPVMSVSPVKCFSAWCCEDTTTTEP